MWLHDSPGCPGCWEPSPRRRLGDCSGRRKNGRQVTLAVTPGLATMVASSAVSKWRLPTQHQGHMMSETTSICSVGCCSAAAAAGPSVLAASMDCETVRLSVRFAQLVEFRGGRRYLRGLVSDRRHPELQRQPYSLRCTRQPVRRANVGVTKTRARSKFHSTQR
jgi:hypothetical protein